jgi:hypothetical protein
MHVGWMLGEKGLAHAHRILRTLTAVKNISKEKSRARRARLEVLAT